ncbi:MAG: heme exporter protein CcmB [Fimbriimonadales bacterium]|nr:heme exporter protein CcmB [Fimbriimonadales bacterium]
MTHRKGGTATLSLGWGAEVAAVVRKEFRVELRGRVGLYSTLVFAVGAVTALGLASVRGEPSPSLAAGLLWVAMLFACVVGLARTFLAEEEQGTGDLLRLIANPGPVFWGKAIFNFLLIVAVAGLVVPLFVLFVRVQVADVGLLVCGTLCGCAGLAAVLSMCGALASRATGRGLLTGVISLPLLLPVLAAGITALRGAFGDSVSESWGAVASLAGMAAAFFAIGPYLYAAVWKQ